MKAPHCITLSLALLCHVATSQVSHVLCGQDLFSDILRTHHPQLHASVQSTFAAASRASPARTQESLVIPVVVHVVWREEAENLPDSVIHDQIRILNEDFNRLNPDTANLRTLFQPEAGAANIKFVLEDIIRVQTDSKFSISLNSTNLLAEVKNSALGGSDVVDPERFLNLWICKIQPITVFGVEVGQILGFAFPPIGLDNWPEDVGAPSPAEDGVVVDYRTVGSNNPNSITMVGESGEMMVKGRTPVHEIGHYFGLRHIWGDGGFLGGPNDCAQSDGIDDTPYASSQSSFDCDMTRNTCTGMDTHYGDDAPDMVENFMDYSREDCMNTFTRGQVELMRNVIYGPRFGLLSPTVATETPGVLSGLRLFPNPSDGPVQVAFDALESTRASFRLWSPDGRLIEQFPPRSLEAGAHTIALPVTTRLPGLYFLEVATDLGRDMLRVVRQ